MIFLPIVERELRVAARKPATYWGRVWMAMVGVMVWLWVGLTSLAYLSPAQTGAHLFSILSAMACGFALMTGVGRASDCLSREKREGTLGLLFLTDLKGYDVVLGKLAATSLGAFYGLVAILPVLAIPLLMGGVTASAFWRVVAMLVNTLFFSLACGLFVSAISRHERKAMGGTLLAIAFVTGGLPLIGDLVILKLTDNRLAEFCFALPSPVYACYLALTDDHVIFPRWVEFWCSVAGTHLLSWFLLGLASWIAPHSWKDKPASLKRLRWRERWRNLILGNAARRNAFRARLLAINPIFWLSSRERQTASYPWIFLGSMGMIWIWAWSLDHQLWYELGVAFFLTYALHLFIKSWVLTTACNSLAADRDQGALELLLSTPLSVAEMLRGQWLAMRRQFLLPIVAILLFDLFWLVLSLRTGKRILSENLAFWLPAYLASLGMFLLDLATLVWVGMWQAVRSRRAGQAGATTLAKVLVLPWLIFAISWLMLIVVGIVSNRWVPWGDIPGPLTVLWFFIGLTVDLVLARRAYLKLHRELRHMVTQRFSAASTPGGKQGGL